MLFVLTGGIQTGKTRWLMRLIEELKVRGALCHGVVSPGIWRKSIAPDGSTDFEKLGIEAVLLPQGERLEFARRRDLVFDEGGCDSRWQSMRAGLGWAIPDTAIDAVNRHFDKLTQETIFAPACNRGLLVVDELGRLELMGAGGFTSALRQLEAGPSPLYGNALAVVRSQLLEQGRGMEQGQRVAQGSQVETVIQQLGEAWEGIELIAPDAHGAQRVISVVEYDRDL